MAHNPRRLEIGSGNNPQPGYEHLEINASCPHVEMCCSCQQIPQPDNTYEEIIAFHILEHMPWYEAEPTLKEWHRVLKPGGTIRLAMPDLTYIIETYLDVTDKMWKAELSVPGWDFPPECHTNKTAWLNFKLYSTDIPFNLHKACFDPSWLAILLERCGFEQVSCVSATMSLHASAVKKK